MSEKITFDASAAWNESNITALRNPIAEFNARGGLDLDAYKQLNQHLGLMHDGQGPALWAELEPQLPVLELLMDRNTGQRLRVQRFNWPEQAFQGPITVNTTQFGVSLDDVRYQNHLIAEQLKTPFIALENPGYGASDKLTPKQKRALQEPTGFRSIAEPMLGILKTMGVMEINILGYSMGADIAAALAAEASEYGMQVRKLFVFESPRTKRQHPAALFKNFIKLGKDLKFTWKNPIDLVQREITELKPGIPNGLWHYGRALSRGGLIEDLLKAVDTQADIEIIVGSAGASTISPSRGNWAAYHLLNHHYLQKSRQIIVPGESHEVRDAAERFAWLCKAVLRN